MSDCKCDFCGEPIDGKAVSKLFSSITIGGKTLHLLFKVSKEPEEGPSLEKRVFRRNYASAACTKFSTFGTTIFAATSRNCGTTTKRKSTRTRKLNVPNSSLRIRIINGRRELTCRECGAVVPIRFGDHRRAFCSERCSRRWHSRKGARQRYAKKHGGKREIVCKFCGVTFVKEFGNPRRDYCSAACRYNAMIARLHEKRKTPDKFYCLMCGEEIVKKHGDKRLKYCSALCMDYYNKYLLAKNKKLVYKRFLEAKEKQNNGAE